MYDKPEDQPMIGWFEVGVEALEVVKRDGCCRITIPYRPTYDSEFEEMYAVLVLENDEWKIREYGLQ